jgi:hypothetical protein
MSASGCRRRRTTVRNTQDDEEEEAEGDTTHGELMLRISGVKTPFSKKAVERNCFLHGPARQRAT